MHQTIIAMLRTAELDMADTVSESDIADFLTNDAWVICFTYHTVLKASPGAEIFGRDMLFDIPFIADWNKIGDYRQCQTDCNTRRENKTHVDWDYKVGDKALCIKMVFSTKQIADMTVILGPSCQFIQMEQSGFNTEQIRTSEY